MRGAALGGQSDDPATRWTMAVQTVDASRRDDVATQSLQIPAEGSRDLQDAVMEHHEAEDWVRWSGGLFRPADDAECDQVRAARVEEREQSARDDSSSRRSAADSRLDPAAPIPPPGAMTQRDRAEHSVRSPA